MSDVVAELRTLLAAYEAVSPERYFAREDRWDVKKEILEWVFSALPAILDVVEATRELYEGGDRPDGSWGRLGHALARLEGEGP